jgi:hypothetical protein
MRRAARRRNLRAQMPAPIPVLEIPDVLDPGACEREIQRAEALGFLAQQYRGEERLEVRNRVSADDPAAAAALWLKLASRVPPIADFYPDGLRPMPDVTDLDALVAVGLNERLRYYRYTGGERFASHVDLSHSDRDVRSFLTVIFYLNDGFGGGETDFFGLSVTPKRGAAILFPHELRHEGRPVFGGTKYVLRTDVMYRAGTARTRA